MKKALFLLLGLLFMGAWTVTDPDTWEYTGDLESFNWEAAYSGIYAVNTVILVEEDTMLSIYHNNDILHQIYITESTHIMENQTLHLQAGDEILFTSDNPHAVWEVAIRRAQVEEPVYEPEPESYTRPTTRLDYVFTQEEKEMLTVNDYLKIETFEQGGVTYVAFRAMAESRGALVTWYRGYETGRTANKGYDTGRIVNTSGSITVLSAVTEYVVVKDGQFFIPLSYAISLLSTG